MIQIDIDIPSSCKECPFRDGKRCILFSQYSDRYEVECYEKRPWWCGLDEVTE